ncbi:organic cation transporter protein-like isoform X4 [Odontomachus brunneus]|uniref:organic cation transporter protein-like isoform X4 n=1 Tax=Odontomachus brunneus TaxID=486640 RepID=UPI0013F1E0C7|nr:organic cation transporter protein-like isoform X4 [Odontomachus brunneus]
MKGKTDLFEASQKNADVNWSAREPKVVFSMSRAGVNVKRVSNGKDDHVDGDANVDAVQTAIDNLGRWQVTVCLAISLVKFPVAWHQLAIVFMAPHQDYNCTEPATTDSKDQCTVNVNGTLVECTEWKYDRSVFSETIISQVRQESTADGFRGSQTGIGDWMRRSALVSSIVADETIERHGYWRHNGMEIVGTKWRAAITVLYQFPFALGHLSLAGLAFWFRHWQQLQIAITLPSIILLSYWWLAPESPRWLLAMGRQKAACKILQKAASINKMENVDIPEVIRKHCLQQNFKKSILDHRASFVDLFRTPNMRIKSLSIFFNWTVCGMGLFGMSQYIGQVGGDIFINFAVSGAIQIPGNFVAWWAMNKLGRRVTLICSNSTAGVACLFLIIVSNDIAWLRLLLACCGIVGIAVSFTTVYLFSGELFPTVVRNIGVGTSSMCARLGSIVAPFVVSLSGIKAWLPPTVFGVLPLIGAALCLLLPETAGCTLPETLQDGEEFGKKCKAKGTYVDAEAEAAF